MDVLIGGDLIREVIEDDKWSLLRKRMEEGKIRAWVGAHAVVSLKELPSFISVVPLRTHQLKHGGNLFELDVLSAHSLGIPYILTGNTKEAEGVKLLKPDEILNYEEAPEVVPFVDLKAQLHDIYNEVDEYFTDIFKTSAFVSGKYVRKFEEEFARYLNVKHVVATNSGTSALILALIAMGVGSGDEVITVPFTFVATLEAIVFLGAKPVFVDIEEETFNMDPNRLEDVLTNRTKVVIPVHLYGQTVNMDPILELKEKYGFYILEDACQAHGAEYRSERLGGWVKAGAIGDAAAFSFYPGKNLGSMGEGGAVSTNNDELAEKMRSLRDHGAYQKYFHIMRGLNLRMANFQGAALFAKLRHLDKWNEMRRNWAKLYDELLSDVEEIETPKRAPYSRHVYHLYVIKAKRRDELREYLASRKVFTGIHYPIVLHLQEAYRELGYREGDFPNSERAAGSVLSLPMYPHLRENQVRRVVKEIKSFYEG